MNPKKYLNYVKYRLAYRNANKLDHKKPVEVALELSSACNMHCQYCYHASPTTLPFKKGFMSLPIAKSIVAEAASLKVPAIKVNYRGEATLNPHFKDIAEFIKQHATNDTFIDRVINSNFNFREYSEDIFNGLKFFTKIKVSFDSFTPEVMEFQRSGSNHNRIMKNISTFHDHYMTKENTLVIQAVRTKLNKDEDIKGLVKKYWPKAKVSIRDMVTGRVVSETSDLLENKSRDKLERQACLQAFARLIFNHEGIAQSCCPDIKSQLQIDSISNISMYEIWNHNNAQFLRLKLKDKSAFNEEPCKSCPSFESYSGYKHPWGS